PLRVLPSFPTRRSSDLARQVAHGSPFVTLVVENVGRAGQNLGETAVKASCGIAISIAAGLLYFAGCAGCHRHDRTFVLKYRQQADRKSTRLNSSHVAIS